MALAEMARPAPVPPLRIEDASKVSWQAVLLSQATPRSTEELGRQLPLPLASVMPMSPGVHTEPNRGRAARRPPPECPKCSDSVSVVSWGRPGWWMCLRQLGSTHFCQHAWWDLDDPLLCPPCGKGKTKKSKKNGATAHDYALEMHYGTWGVACRTCKKFEPMA